MLCPRDEQQLIAKPYEGGVEVDACTACGGMWLDAGELEKIEEARERDWSKELEQVDAVIQSVAARRNGPAKCPKCAADLVVEEYAYCSRIHVDVCPAGHGVWLDGGELHALEVFFEEAKRRANAEDEALWKIRAVWASLRGLFRRR